MKKRLFSILLSFLICISVLPVTDVSLFAAESLYTYNIINSSNKTVEITKYSGTEEIVDIPQTIDGYTVVGLSSGAFINNSSIKIINIPETVSSILCYFNSPNIEEINVDVNNANYSSQDGVLYDKSKETLIRCPYNYQSEIFVVPQTVKIISSYAFKTDASVRGTYSTMLEIKINDGVEELKPCAFSYTRFNEIILPDSVKKIGNSAFFDTLARRIHFGSGVEQTGKEIFTTSSGGRTPRLSKITVSDENEIYSSVDGVLFGNHSRELIAYPQNKNDVKEYKIPDGVTYIHSCAMQACAFDKLDLNNVTEIAENAFMNSTIKGFVIPECLNDFYYHISSSGVEFTVLNPYCNFRVSYFNYGTNVYKYKITVKAYENSTAQEFVNNNTNSDVTYNFISLGKYSDSSDITEPDNPDEPQTPEEPSDSAFSYSIIGEDSIKIDAYNGSDVDLLIPSKIDGYTVKEIGNSVFSEKELISVVIPDSVSCIGRNAFNCCNSLRYVTMPCSAEIMSKAFYGCDNIENVVLTVGTGEMTNYSYELPLVEKDNSYMQTAWYRSKKAVDVILCNGIKNIGNYAFYRCSNVRTVTMPKSVASIGTRAFYLCKGLQNISVSPDNQTYCDVNGVLYSKDKSTLILYPAGRSESSYDIIENTTAVSDYAFAFCQNLNALNIPDSLSKLGTLSIYDCEALKEVNATENNEAYFSSKGVLYSKDKATLIYYPSGKDDEFYVLPTATVIGERAVCFTNYESINIPRGVKKISQYAFYSNKNLNEIILPSSLEYVDSNVFDYCSSLSKIKACSFECEYNGKSFPSSSVIYACIGSSVQKYAEKYENPFASIGHNYVEKTVSASCTQDGFVFKECTVCNYSFKTGEVKSPGHKYTTKVTKATFDKTGTATTVCDTCGYVCSKQSIAKIKSVSLSKSSYVYTGKNLSKPTVTVKDSNGKTISSSNYTISYISRSTGKSITSLKGIGQYKVKVVFKGNYSSTKYLYFSVKPKNMTIKSPTTGSKYVNAKWNKDTSASGYQVVIATNSSFTKNKRTVTIGKNPTTSYKFTKLKKGTRYYIKVRSYKTIKVDGKSAKMYSNYSSVKSIICK